MSKVRITAHDELIETTVRDRVPPERRHRFSEVDLDARIAYFEEGTDNSPQLFRVRHDPGVVTDIHAHDEDEIIYVMEGEMIVGNRVLKPGSSVYVAGNTLYGFKAGPNGLTFLNFRPRVDRTFHTKEDFLRRRSEARAKSMADG